MSILLLLCVCQCVYIATLGVGLGSHPVTSLGCKSYCSRLCQNPSGAMYILVRNRLQTGGSQYWLKMYNKGLLAVPQRVRTRIVKKKTLAALPPSPNSGGGQSKILPESEIWKRGAVRNLFLPLLARGHLGSRWTMRIRGGLFTRAPECRLNGLEMDLSQIRAVARGELKKREQLEVAGKGRRVFWWRANANRGWVIFCKQWNVDDELMM